MNIIISIVFISVTLFVVGFRWLSEGSVKSAEAEDAILAAIWAALGTFFFYNLLM